MSFLSSTWANNLYLHSCGTYLSVLCAVHCLATPILLLFAASHSALGFLMHPLFEVFLLLGILLVSGFAIYGDFRQKRYGAALWLRLLGLLFLLIGFGLHLHLLMGFSGLSMGFAQLIGRFSVVCCSANATTLSNN